MICVESTVRDSPLWLQTHGAVAGGDVREILGRINRYLIVAATTSGHSVIFCWKHLLKGSLCLYGSRTALLTGE